MGGGVGHRRHCPAATVPVREEARCRGRASSNSGCSAVIVRGFVRHAFTRVPTSLPSLQDAAQSCGRREHVSGECLGGDAQQAIAGGGCTPCVWLCIQDGRLR